MLIEPRLSPRSVLALLLPLAALAAAPPARAQGQVPAPAPQVSDADRAAARELATQGLQLQQQGKFADALDRFDRAQAVFSAPTHLLHIAECLAAIGKLVESAEQYRTLVRTKLPDHPPAAFVQAQQEGAAELSQVEPRIPSIRIIVRPHPARNSAVYFDGDTTHPMNEALIGMQRPMDPGPHTIELRGDGYAPATQKIVLKEKETQDVVFNLGGNPGGYYTPPPVTPAQPAPMQPPPPPMYGAQPSELPPPEHQPARGGFMLGATVGVLVPAGNVSQNASLSDVVSAGADVQINGGFRFANRLYMGLTFEHGFLGAGKATTGLAPVGGTASADSNLFGFDFAVTSNPDGVGFWGKVGVAYRIMDISVTDPSTGNTSSGNFNGAEVSLAAGVHIKLGDWVRLVPGGSVSIGQFSSSSNGSVSNPDTHEFILLGVTAFVDFARKH